MSRQQNQTYSDSSLLWLLLGMVAVVLALVLLILIPELADLNANHKLFIELLPSLATTLTAAITAIFVVWQVGKQGRNNLELQRLNLQQDLKRKVYTQMVEVVDKSQDAEVSCNGLIMQVEMQYNSALSSVKVGLPYTMNITGKDISAANDKMHAGITALIVMIERYEIIDPRLKIFRMAFSYVSEEIRKCFNPLFIYSLGVLSLKDKNDKFLERPLPQPVQYKELNRLAKLYSRQIELLGCYIQDFRIEMQNLLLGELFDNRVPFREPIDPFFHIIKLRDYDNLELLFLNTEWGKKMKQTQDDLRREFNLTSDAE